jgi:putative chromate ion transporter
VVTHYHWLSERQFLDAVAVAMITPGPVVITAGFVGYLVAGPIGAVLAALAVFAPPYLIVVFGAPYYRRFAKNIHVRAFVQGVTAAAVGAIAGGGIHSWKTSACGCADSDDGGSDNWFAGLEENPGTGVDRGGRNCGIVAAEAVVPGCQGIS